MATFAIGDEGESDEVNIYQTGRYISSNEATWRIFGFDIHQQYPRSAKPTCQSRKWTESIFYSGYSS